MNKTSTKKLSPSLEQWFLSNTPTSITGWPVTEGVLLQQWHSALRSGAVSQEDLSSTQVPAKFVKEDPIFWSRLHDFDPTTPESLRILKSFANKPYPIHSLLEEIAHKKALDSKEFIQLIIDVTQLFWLDYKTKEKLPLAIDVAGWLNFIHHQVIMTRDSHLEECYLKNMDMFGSKLQIEVVLNDNLNYIHLYDQECGAWITSLTKARKEELRQYCLKEEIIPATSIVKIWLEENKGAIALEEAYIKSLSTWYAADMQKYGGSKDRLVFRIERLTDSLVTLTSKENAARALQRWLPSGVLYTLWKSDASSVHNNYLFELLNKIDTNGILEEPLHVKKGKLVSVTSLYEMIMTARGGNIITGSRIIEKKPWLLQNKDKTWLPKWWGLFAIATRTHVDYVETMIAGISLGLPTTVEQKKKLFFDCVVTKRPSAEFITMLKKSYQLDEKSTDEEALDHLFEDWFQGKRNVVTLASALGYQDNIKEYRQYLTTQIGSVQGVTNKVVLNKELPDLTINL